MEVVELKVAVAVAVDAAASREAASTKLAAYEAATFKLFVSGQFYLRMLESL